MYICLSSHWTGNQLFPTVNELYFSGNTYILFPLKWKERVFGGFFFFFFKLINWWVEREIRSFEQAGLELGHHGLPCPGRQLFLTKTVFLCGLPILLKAESLRA